MADLQPCDSSERTCLATAVFHSLELDRVMLAQNARITAQIKNAPAEQARREQEEAMALGKRLFPSRLIPQKWIRRPAALPESPACIARRLQTTAAGCLWLLDHWAELKAILDRNLPWQPSDKFKLVRLLGREPLDAVIDPRVARLQMRTVYPLRMRLRAMPRPIKPAPIKPILFMERSSEFQLRSFSGRLFVPPVGRNSRHRSESHSKPARRAGARGRAGS